MQRILKPPPPAGGGGGGGSGGGSGHGANTSGGGGNGGGSGSSSSSRSSSSTGGGVWEPSEDQGAPADPATGPADADADLEAMLGLRYHFQLFDSDEAAAVDAPEWLVRPLLLLFFLVR